jgi:hypothetical protein
MFWGIMLVVWIWCQVAEMLRIEQPRTRVPDYALQPSQQLRTSMLGDSIDKGVVFYTRGLLPLTITHMIRAESQVMVGFGTLLTMMHVTSIALTGRDFHIL